MKKLENFSLDNDEGIIKKIEKNIDYISKLFPYKTRNVKNKFKEIQNLLE